MIRILARFGGAMLLAVAVVAPGKALRPRSRRLTGPW